MTHLVLYGTKEMYRSAVLCKQSAYKQGISYVWQWEEPALKNTEFYEQNKELLDQPRGCGYWAWKPFIILDTLLNRCNDGDICIYADAGIEWVNSSDHIINRMDQDIFLFGNMYNHLHWCKADCWVPILSNQYYGYKGKQCQASVLFVRKTDKAVEFIKSWLSLCLQAGMIDDSPSKLPNDPEFQEHRHDQAILTCLAIRDGIKLHWWPAMYNNGAFTYEKGNYTDTYPVIFHHHRKRNNEWLNGDHMNMQNSVR